MLRAGLSVDAKPAADHCAWARAAAVCVKQPLVHEPRRAVCARVGWVHGVGVGVTDRAIRDSSRSVGPIGIRAAIAVARTIGIGIHNASINKRHIKHIIASTIGEIGNPHTVREQRCAGHEREKGPLAAGSTKDIHHRIIAMKRNTMAESL